MGIMGPHPPSVSVRVTDRTASWLWTYGKKEERLGYVSDLEMLAVNFSQVFFS
jgi:hypothetical protein